MESTGQLNGAMVQEIEKTKTRMESNERQAAKGALKAGGREISRGRYYEGGPIVVTVACPAGWWFVNGREIKTVSYIQR